MTPLEPDPLLDPLRARRQRLRRAVLVAHFPVEDVVRLALAVRAEQDLVGLRGERIRDDRQRRVVDLHRLGAIDRHGCSKVIVVSRSVVPISPQRRPRA